MTSRTLSDDTRRSWPVRAIARIGAGVRTAATNAGQVGLLLRDVVQALVRFEVPLRSILRQLNVIGVQSIPIVMVVGVLSGIVTSQQGGYQFTGAIPLYVLGSVVTASIVLELGPVLTAIVLVARVGARITAEIGTMKVSEQLDAFHALGRNPVAMLAAPRIVACLISMPLLAGIAMLVGIFSGMVSADVSVGLGPESFIYGARLYWHSWDLVYGLMKSVVFGFAIPVIACHMGFQTRGGAEGVGRTTTGAAMLMTLTVLILDALFPPLFLN